MNIFSQLTGKRFKYLIKYFFESKEKVNSETSYTYKCALEFIDGKKPFGSKTPSPVSTVFLTLLLILSFMLPCQTITLILALPEPKAAMIIYPSLLVINALMIITMRSILKGRVWTLITYKYVYIVNIILLLLSIILSIYTGKAYRITSLINAGIMVWARILINSNSYFRLQEYYLHRRLSRLILKKPSNNKTKVQK